jgi:phosphate-selective porin
MALGSADAHHHVRAHRGGVQVLRTIRLAFAAAIIGVCVISTGTATAASPVKITLKCYSSPEKTTIKNTSTSSLKVKNFGSTYQAYSAEPFRVNKTLAPGQSVTYKTGHGRGTIYGNYIYNDNGRDGVKVVTSVGTYTKHC